MKEAQLRLSRQLREEGKTWVEIAGIFRREYAVNARVAMRIARGWSQADAADQWNQRWPDDPKTFKNFSYWEQWPGKTGHAPSLYVLGRLAELYQCRAADLLVDQDDYRDADQAYRSRAEVSRLPAAIASSTPAAAGAEVLEVDGWAASHDLADFVRRLQASDVNDLARVTSGWAQHLEPGVDRRALLLKLSFALTLAAASSAADVSMPPAEALPAGHVPDLRGIWRSEYTYMSSGRQAEFRGVHFVMIDQKGTNLDVTSLRHSTGSKVRLALTVDGLAATGTWEERTSPTGYYKGTIYRGAVQLLLTPSMTHMTGKWLGFGKDFAINTGPWNLTLEDRSTSARTRAQYDLRV